MKYGRGAAALLGALAVSSATAIAGPILDASYFSGVPHALIDFETDGTGNDVSLNQATSIPMPADAYAPRGVLFSQAIRWVNDGDADFDAAQAIGGSLDVAVPGAASDDFVLQFLEPVRAFGFWVVNRRQSAVVPSFEARDASGELIGSVTFSGNAIDGTIGIAQYGFLGIAAEQDIYSVRIRKDAALLDDLRFISMPEPGSMLVFGLAAGVAAKRRRG